MTGISVCSPLFETPFATVVLDGFLSMIKGTSSTNRLPFPSFYFGLGVTTDAAKPDCVIPTGDNGLSYESCSSGKLIVIKLNETLLSRQQQSCQKCEHRKSMKHSKKISTWISLLKRNNLLAKLCFL
jgi:hypothetical protein